MSEEFESDGAAYATVDDSPVEPAGSAIPEEKTNVIQFAPALGERLYREIRDNELMFGAASDIPETFRLAYAWRSVRSELEDWMKYIWDEITGKNHRADSHSPLCHIDIHALKNRLTPFKVLFDILQRRGFFHNLTEEQKYNPGVSRKPEDVAGTFMHLEYVHPQQYAILMRTILRLRRALCADPEFARLRDN